jgi:hypothetical protein
MKPGMRRGQAGRPESTALEPISGRVVPLLLEELAYIFMLS